MAETPTRAPKESAQAPPGDDAREPTPFEKMTELTRRLIHVRKDELPNKGKSKKRKHP
jgi:hypothetical protein